MQICHKNFPGHLQRNVTVIILASLLTAQEMVMSRAAAALLKITQVADLLCVFREPVIMSLLPYNKWLQNAEFSQQKDRKAQVSCQQCQVCQRVNMCIKRIARDAGCSWRFSLWRGYVPSSLHDKEEEKKQLLSKIRSERPVGQSELKICDKPVLTSCTEQLNPCRHLCWEAPCSGLLRRICVVAGPPVAFNVFKKWWAAVCCL